MAAINKTKSVSSSSKKPAKAVIVTKSKSGAKNSLFSQKVKAMNSLLGKAKLLHS